MKAERASMNTYGYSTNENITTAPPRLRTSGKR